MGTDQGVWTFICLRLQPRKIFSPVYNLKFDYGYLAKADEWFLLSAEFESSVSVHFDFHLSAVCTLLFCFCTYRLCS